MSKSLPSGGPRQRRSPGDAHRIETDVYEQDRDRWLSSRFIADAAKRAAVIAFYALDAELARVGTVATNVLAGEIRLAWWREEVEAAARGGVVAANPVLKALAQVGAALPLDAIETIIEARRLALGAEPFADEAALVAHIDAAEGAAMLAAASLLAGTVQPSTLLHVARAWGWAKVVRGITPRPADWSDAAPQEVAAHISHRISDALRLARGELRSLPVEAFPAVAHAALAKRYLQGHAPSELEKRVRITWAVMRGRV